MRHRSESGEISPLRIQMKGEDHQLIRINIEQVLKRDEIFHVGTEAKIFLCRATVWDQKWLFELKYTIRTHSWCLFRRVY